MGELALWAGLPLISVGVQVMMTVDLNRFSASPKANRFQVLVEFLRMSFAPALGSPMNTQMRSSIIRTSYFCSLFPIVVLLLVAATSSEIAYLVSKLEAQFVDRVVFQTCEFLILLYIILHLFWMWRVRPLLGLGSDGIYSARRFLFLSLIPFAKWLFLGIVYLLMISRAAR